MAELQSVDLEVEQAKGDETFYENTFFILDALTH